MTPNKIIESLIFVSDSPMKPASIMEVFEGKEFKGINLDESTLSEILDGLSLKYNSDEFPFELKKIDGGYQFFSKKEYFPYLRHAALLSNRRKLSRTALESLAIIAYRQPVTKTEIEFIRGVNCDYAIQKLLEKKLIRIKGRADAPGRPLLYETSQFFMEYFGLNDISDLPKLEEFTIDEDAFQEQFKVYIEEKDELEEVINEGRISEPETGSVENPPLVQWNSDEESGNTIARGEEEE